MRWYKRLGGVAGTALSHSFYPDITWVETFAEVGGTAPRPEGYAPAAIVVGWRVWNVYPSPGPIAVPTMGAGTVRVIEGEVPVYPGFFLTKEAAQAECAARSGRAHEATRAALNYR